MKLLLYLNFFALALHSTRAKVEHSETDYLISLILRTREFYSSSAVIFAHPADIYGGYGDLHTTHIVHRWSQILGRELIVTLNVNFRNMYKLEKNLLVTTQPLIVVLIPHLEALFEFSNATKTFKMSFPTWLVIFLQTPSNEEHNYCHEPIGNSFNLAFDTIMLVSCHDDDILREWYSLDNNTTEIFELATYDPLRGIVLRTNLSLCDRRKDMKGTILRVVAMKKLVLSRKKKKFQSYLGGIFMELAQTLNFTIKIVHVSTEYGAFNSATQAWSGAIGEFVSGHADIGVGSFAMATDRLNVVDFLVPLGISRECLFLKKPEVFHMQWSTYFKAFSPAIWLSIGIIITIFTVIIILIKKYSRTVTKVRTVSEEFLQIWGIFCQQGLGEFSESPSLRVAYLTLFATALVVSAAYSASLIHFLATRIPFLPFSSIHEFIEVGSHKLIAIRGSAQYDAIANSKDPVSVGLMKLMRPFDTLPKESSNAFQIICKDSKLALYSTTVVMKSLSSAIPCELSIIDTEEAFSYSFILSKDSPYTSCFKHELQKFQSGGLLHRYRVANRQVENDRDITFQTVEIFNVIMVLAIIVSGVLMSIVTLILETLYYNYAYRKKSGDSINTPKWTGFEYLE